MHLAQVMKSAALCLRPLLNHTFRPSDIQNFTFGFTFSPAAVSLSFSCKNAMKAVKGFLGRLAALTDFLLPLLEASKPGCCC